MTSEYLDLVDQIDSLSEFLYDDYGDTVDQLGIDKTNELESDLKDLKEQLRTLNDQE
jgi:predicted HAD superfamily Cof-like phosphohydrolase